MSEQPHMDPRVKVHKSFLHPAQPGGAPVMVGIFNIVFIGVTVALLHWWPGVLIAAMIHFIFAWLGRKHPFYPRYMLRNYWRPITYLDN